MWVLRVENGFVFGDLSAGSVETLKGVPMLIESSDPRVRERLLPETCVDPDDEQQWREHAVPELERLFLSRAQLVRRDLQGLQKQPDSDHSMLLIRDEHKNAWLSALNAARLALFVLNDLEAEHMEPENFGSVTPKQQEALLRIHLLAQLQSVLLGDFDEDQGDTLWDTFADPDES